MIIVCLELNIGVCFIFFWDCLILVVLMIIVCLELNIIMVYVMYSSCKLIFTYLHILVVSTTPFISSKTTSVITTTETPDQGMNSIMYSRRFMTSSHKIFFTWNSHFHQCKKQPSMGVLMKTCSENMQQVYRRTPMPKWISIKSQSKSHFGMGVAPL